MAGLFDFLGQQPGNGLLGGGFSVADASPFGGLTNNQNAILGYLAGALQGGNLGESIGRGLMGWQAGGQADTQLANQRQAQRAALSYVAGSQDIDPPLRAALLANPALATQYLTQRAKPPELKFEGRGDLYGAFNPQTGIFNQLGVAPSLQKLGPGDNLYSVTPGTGGIPGSASPIASGGPEKPPSGYEYVDAANPAAGYRATIGGPAFGDAAKTLRTEVQQLPSYKNLAQAAPVYTSMLDASKRDDRASDVNLIYGLAKVMDPGSVVRESEMSVAQAIATLPQRLQAEIKSQIVATGRLSPEVRQGIMREAYSRVQSYQSMFDTDAGMYRGIATRARIAHEDVIPGFGELRPPTAANGSKGDALTLKQKYGLE